MGFCAGSTGLGVGSELGSVEGPFEGVAVGSLEGLWVGSSDHEDNTLLFKEKINSLKICLQNI